MTGNIRPRDVFSDFIIPFTGENHALVMADFDMYLELLWQANAKVNLISRQMKREDYWLYHFLDSVLILKCMDFSEERILDFGTGGGLPGIPLKLMFPKLQLTLLDSVSKKAKAVQEIVRALALTGCEVVCNRLEDYAAEKYAAGFDRIVCRSVKLEPRFVPALRKLLARNGELVFYKAYQAEDVSFLPGASSFEVSHPQLGFRQIIRIPASGLNKFRWNDKQSG